MQVGKKKKEKESSRAGLQRKKSSSQRISLSYHSNHGEGISRIFSANHFPLTLTVYLESIPVPPLPIELVYSRSSAKNIFSFSIQRLSFDDSDRLVLGFMRLLQAAGT
jgi:hypothetical protein